MTDKAKRIEQILEALYPSPPIPLTHDDPYTLLVAVLLSAQCTDKRVNQVTPALFALANTPEKMKNVSVDEIRAIIRPCGLSPTKSKNIHALSQILVDEHNSVVPRELAALERLPGVGHKTASVVVCQAFSMAAFPVDTHIFRLARRWGLSQANNVKGVEKDLKRLFPEERWAKLHLQIIYFGREYCPARQHEPAQCPICVWASE
jgi:endonuclease-3